jgi:hypothetical protein
MRASSALAGQRRQHAPASAQHADDGVQQRHRHLLEARRAAQQREQQLRPAGAA